VITPVNADSLTLRLIGHEVEDEPVPKSDPASITRLPEADESAAWLTETENMRGS
jgi:hypothetical protein